MCEGKTQQAFQKKDSGIFFVHLISPQKPMIRFIRFVVLLCFYLCTSFLWSNTSLLDNTAGEEKHTNSSSRSLKDSIAIGSDAAIKKETSALSVKIFRNFESLEQFDTPVPEKQPQKFSQQSGFHFKTSDSLQNNKWLEMAKDVFDKIEETKNYIDELKDESLGTLPVAINPIEISNVKYTVGIAKAVFKPQYTELTVFLKIETARGVLILGADDIKLSHEGGIVGDARLSLISQFTVNFNNGSILLTLNGGFETQKTYATIDCSGFKELSLDANIKFSNSLIYPVDEDGKEKLGYVESSFKLVASDWNDMLINISLPEFGIKGVDGTTFRLNTAVFDFSDLRNDPQTPSTYLATYYSEGPELWRGVYIQSLEVVLPKAFAKRGSEERIAFGATDMIIDSQGVSGKFTGENILTIDEGSASKWQFSLDYFKLEIETNSLKAGEFSGEFLLPVSSVDRLKYNAIIQPDEYSFRVASTDEIDFDLWNAKVTLTKDSYIEMKIEDDKFRPKASLNGSFNITSGLKKEDPGGGNTIRFDGIVFEKLELQTESPKFSVAYFGAKGSMGIANFPVSINEIGLRLPSGDRAELVFDFNINLTSEGDGGNGGGSKLAIKAKLEDDNGSDRWRYDGVDLERVNIQMDVAGMQLKGAIFIFEDDPTYGKGFAGAVGAKLTVGMSLDVEVKALFGRTEEFRYWFADAQVTLPTPIPIFTGFAINSFGGGFYNRMKMDGISYNPNAAFTEIGASTSGVIYVPDGQNGFGFKASVGIITQNSEELFNGSLEFGMSFLRSGGLQEIYFKGEGRMISGIPGDFYEKLTEKLALISEGAESMVGSFIPDAAISANVFIKFDFANDVFHATSELYINFGSFLKGIGPNGRAGWLDFYVSSDEWHLLIGTPGDPVGTKMIGTETRSYFMMGDGLPGSPAPPPMVAQMLGVDAEQLAYTRDLNLLEAGRGFAFGSHFAMSTGDLKFLIFYARFDAGFGFDVMVKDYGDAHCKGSSEQIGMNGWYANGQAYAYLQGKVGLKVKLFFKTKKIDIFSGGGAILVQARLPNPSWLVGYLKGKYSVMGGLVKGSFRFKVEVGEKCEIVGESALEGIVVIGDIVPKEASTNVDVFALPQVAFNLPLNKVFELPDDEGDHKYKIMMDKFELSKDDTVLPGKIEWNETNDVAVFYSHEVLPPTSEINVYVQLHFEEYIDGKWEVIMNNGKPANEIKELTFTTGLAPTNIPLTNIAYMYPVLGQKNFYTKEYATGYVNLKRGQSYLFDEVPNWEKQALFQAATGIKELENFGYNSANKQVTFSIPKNLSTATEYTATLALVPPESEVTGSITESYSTTNLGEDENDVSIRSRSIDQLSVKGEERELLTYGFRTSTYTSFQSKVNAMKKRQDLYLHLSMFELILQQDMDADEPFDLIDLVGNTYSGNRPLVITKADMNNKYYKNYIYPLLYQNYPSIGEVRRETSAVGVPPIEGVEPVTSYVTYLENGIFDTEDFNPYSYNLTYYFYRDYIDLRNQLILKEDVALLRQHPELVTETFPFMRKGDYQTTWEYTLPGQSNASSAKNVKYYNPLYE